MDQDVLVQKLEQDELSTEDLEAALMDGQWNVNRIHQLARVRCLLTEKSRENARAAIETWNSWRSNPDKDVTDNFIFFVLRFLSGKGDEIKLSHLPLECTISQDLTLEIIPGFIFIESEMESLRRVEQHFQNWQPIAIPSEIQVKIIEDLEGTRSLGEAQTILLSVARSVQQNAEPLLISRKQSKFISSVIEKLRETGIVTERHLSNETLSILERHMKLEVRHLPELLKSIGRRMRGDLFGGRIPVGWDSILPEDLAQSTLEQLRASNENILDMLTQLINSINTPEPATYLKPQESLLTAIRFIEGDDWNHIDPQCAWNILVTSSFWSNNWLDVSDDNKISF
jgi:hypothetical protein